MGFHRRTFAHIDLAALQNNVNWIRQSLPADHFFCPMVKANGYGHGDVLVSKALESFGVRHLGVCSVDEGLALRQAGIQTEILVFLGSAREDLAEMLRARLTPVLNSWEQIEILEKLANKPVSVHLKFDTGMNRLGFGVQEATALFQRLEKSPQIKVEALLTHLFRGEDANRIDGDTASQLQSFSQVAKIFLPLRPVLHVLNSAGLVHRLSQSPSQGHPLFSQNWGSRPGLMIYGYAPVPNSMSGQLKPVMTLTSEVEVYHQVPRGQGVSYNRTWKATRDSVVAVVPIGYADGYHRSLSNRADVLFAGKRVPVVGSVCMDYLMLDVTDEAQKQNLKRGQEVILFGTDRQGQLLGADELAQKAQTITWEILTSVGSRVPRTSSGSPS